MLCSPPRALVLAFLSVLLPATALAQPIEWGEVSDEELAFSEYPADPDASWLVLADYGTLTFKNTFEPYFERHVRIKILREAGYDAAKVELSYVHEDRAEGMVRIQGQTFVQDADGDVRRVKLDKGDIFKEKLNDRYTLVTFTLPALEPGAVIEYRYTKRSDSPYWVPSWRFQDEAPTLHSEFVADVPRVLDYVRAKQGIEIEETEVGKVISEGEEAMRYRWVARDVPALRDEPFMSAAKDYETRLDLQLRSYYHRGQGEVQVLGTWEELGTELWENADFGRRFGRAAVARKAEELTAGLDAPREKLQALYDFVSTSIATTNYGGWLAFNDLDDVLASGSGTFAEATLLFVDMARAVGLEADPVLISTRSHGLPMKLYPLQTQFNALLVRASVDNRPLFLSPTSPLLPMGMLPPETRVAEGWVPGVDGSSWTRILTPHRAEQTVKMTGALGADGRLAGRVEAAHDGYDGYLVRARLLETTADALVQETLLSAVPGAEAGAADLTVPDSLAAPVQMAFDLSIPEYAQTVGDRMYLDPAVMLKMQEHPFPSRTRVSDVSYSYRGTQTWEAEIALPEGYVVEELPPARRHRTPGGVLVYTRTVEAEGDSLVVKTIMARRKTELGRRHYDELRAFYDNVLAAQEDRVVLRRADAATEEVGAASGRP